MIARRQFVCTCAGLAASARGAFAAAPRRIVSTSPSITDLLYGIGAFDRVVAVCDYCTFPPGVYRLPRIGGWLNGNLEKIASVRPDLVILNAAQAVFLEAGLRQYGTPTLMVPGQTLGDVFTAMDLLGSALGNQAQARELARQTRAGLDRIRARTRCLPRRSVLLVIDRTPGTFRDIYVATEGGYLAELLEIAGAKSVAGRAPSVMASRISKEAILEANPDLIVEMVHSSKGKADDDPARIWQALPELAAVRKGQVRAIARDSVAHPSQFVVDTAGLLARIVHPEAFARASACP